jgi:hypothetical protein
MTLLLALVLAIGVAAAAVYFYYPRKAPPVATAEPASEVTAEAVPPPPTSLRDGFETLSDYWLLPEVEDTSARVEGGSLHVQAMNRSAVVEFLSPQGTFDFEIKAAAEDDLRATSYGIVIKTRGETYETVVFEVAKNGRIRQLLAAGGETHVVQDWTAMPEVNKGNAENVLRVKVRTLTAEFSVNGTEAGVAFLAEGIRSLSIFVASKTNGDVWGRVRFDDAKLDEVMDASVP